MKILGISAGILAFLGCFGAGAWLLFSDGFDFNLEEHRQDPLGFGLALYFMGKGFFVGAMLILTSVKLGAPDGCN